MLGATVRFDSNAAAGARAVPGTCADAFDGADGNFGNSAQGRRNKRLIFDEFCRRFLDEATAER